MTANRRPKVASEGLEVFPKMCTLARYSTRSSLGSLFFHQKNLVKSLSHLVDGRHKTLIGCLHQNQLLHFRKRGSTDRRRLFQSGPCNNWLFREIFLNVAELSYTRRTLFFLGWKTGNTGMYQHRLVSDGMISSGGMGSTNPLSRVFCIAFTT